MQCTQQSMGGIFLLLLQAWSLKPDAELSQVVFKGQRRHEEHVGAAPRAAAARLPPPCTRHIPRPHASPRNTRELLKGQRGVVSEPACVRGGRPFRFRGGCLC